MLTQYWHCDACKERIHLGDRVSLKVIAGADRHADPIDFCGTCYRDFKAWLDHKPRPRPEAMVTSGTA